MTVLIRRLPSTFWTVLRGGWHTQACKPRHKGCRGSLGLRVASKKSRKQSMLSGSVWLPGSASFRIMTKQTPPAKSPAGGWKQ